MFAIIVGIAANMRGRSGFGWFLLAVVISPLLAGLLVLALPDLRRQDDARAMAMSQDAINQMAFDALPDDAKDRVRAAQTERAQLALIESKRRKRAQLLRGGFFLIIIVVVIVLYQMNK
jgi:hypothetical protein